MLQNKKRTQWSLLNNKKISNTCFLLIQKSSIFNNADKISSIFSIFNREFIF